MALPNIVQRLLQPNASLAERVKTRKAQVEAEFTEAQQRAHAAFAAGQAAFQSVARLEYESVIATLNNARERLRAIIDTEALPHDVIEPATDVHDNLDLSVKRDT